MWWLALALFLICVIEVNTTDHTPNSIPLHSRNSQKNQLSDSANESWFNLFSMSKLFFCMT